MRRKHKHARVGGRPDAAPRALPSWSRTAGAFAALFAAYCAIFGRFIPTASGKLGHDYAYFVPNLFDGYCWFRVNGLFAVPWFTPSFGGGSLGGHANLQRAYYGLPQFLTFVVDPLTAVQVSVFAVAALGWLSFYLLLRRSFQLSWWSSIFGSALFLFNGFYINRMLIGHLGYNLYMLVPLVAHLCLRPLPPAGSARGWRIAVDAVGSGVLVALMAKSDLISILLPALLSVVAVAAVHAALFGRAGLFWSRFLAGGAWGVLCALSKLTAVAYFLRNFPRSDYLLPGAKSLFQATLLAVRCLFVTPAWDPFRNSAITNIQWTLERHEWEYSLTVVPLLVLGFGAFRLARGLARGVRPRVTAARGAHALLLLVLVALPIAFNTYSPRWHAFLDAIPLLRSSSTLFRWFILYIPLVIVAAALVVEHAEGVAKHRRGLVLAALALMVLLKSAPDRSFYEQQQYDPSTILAAYARVRDGAVPRIEGVAYFQDAQGKPALTLDRNDLVARGLSQMYCYEAIFGYRLEYLPMKTLHPGPALAEGEDPLNVKNPACYLWPKENGCTPGDHFRRTQLDAARAFLAYRPFPFRMPLRQRVANATSLVAWGASLAFLALHGVRRFRRTDGRGEP